MSLPILCTLGEAAKSQWVHVTTQLSSAASRDRGATEQALDSRKVIEYASLDSARPTALH